MKIAILKEQQNNESRVAASPDSVKRFVKLGAEVSLLSGAGKNAGYSDADYREAGANISKSASAACKDADVVLCVNAPDYKTLSSVAKGAHLVGMLTPPDATPSYDAYKDAGIHAYSMEKLPRISRAQSMDVLSSQSNLAGYRAVIEAVALTGKVVPMMMTAAGTVTPAKVLVLGAGVAGLQAIATAKRLGAVVSAFDVRPAVKEQVESLGASFIEVKNEGDDAETSGGYAKEMSEDYKRRQSELIAKTIAKQDIVITTALIPGRPAPELITDEMVKAMKTGSVVVDLAAAAGGNYKKTKCDAVSEEHGVHIIGYSNLPSRAAVDASALYARNLYNFVSTLFIDKEGQLDVQWEDELVRGTLVTPASEAAQAQPEEEAVKAEADADETPDTPSDKGE